MTNNLNGAISGLNTNEVNQRILSFGYNELPSAKPKNVFRIAIETVKEPMFLLLISCGTLYLLLGNYKEGILLLSSIFIIIFITFYQYQKTEKALEALKNLASPRALVLRDGKEIRIAGREVVPDDVIVINEGDRVPADAALLDCLNVSVDESLLSGESVPVSKTIHSAESTTPESSTPKSSTQGLLYSGTLVVQGKGYAKVLTTGAKTQFGKIGASLNSVEQDETRLQKEMKKLIGNLFIASAFISISVVALFYFTRGNFLKSLLNGLASAMAILPEEFPVVLTVFLALGSWRLSKKNILTRKPSAIETLGSATVLCSDKTGTITQNKMQVAALYEGKTLFERNSFQENKKQIQQLISTAFYASQKHSIDPMEKAIETSYQEIVTENNSTDKLIKEYPLSKQLFAMTRVLQTSSGESFLVCSKGAPEAIFELCKMSGAEIEPHLSVVNQMAENGYRVIAVAMTTWNQEKLPELQQEYNLQFLGLIGLEDPIRLEVPNAIKECNEAGIKVIMITGDYPATAKSIAKQIGLLNSENLLTGSDLSQMDEALLKQKITTTNVFARIIPEQKLLIIKALKANGEIVAMTGDGVNDAPALKAADIGIAMGGKGTDVAREASSLVLLDDNFASIVSAIRSGRKIYDNLQKAMSYIMAIHVPIIGLALLPAFSATLPLLLMPLHIVFLELVIDPICSIAFETEQEEKGIMQRPPRDPKALFFGWKKITFSIFQGLVLLTMVISVYFLSIHEGHSEGEVRAIAFSSLIIGNVFLILTSLSKTRNVFLVLLEKNIAVISIISIALTLLFLTLTIPALQGIFSFEFPGFKHFISSLTGAALILAVFESIKFINRTNTTSPLPKLDLKPSKLDD